MSVLSGGSERADIIAAIRDFQHYRDAFGDATLVELDAPDVVAAIDNADELVRVVSKAFDIKRYEL